MDLLHAGAVMPLDIKELEDDFKFGTFSLTGGIDLSQEPSAIEPETSPAMSGLVYNKHSVQIDTGYVKIGSTLTGKPRRVIKWEKKNGSIEFVNITNSTVYRWNDTLLKWLKLPGATRTTASLGEAAGSTAIDVASGVGFANGNTIQITLDNGDLHETTISSGGGTTTLNVAAGIPVGRNVAIGALIFKAVALSGSDDATVDFAIFNAVDWLILTNDVDPVQRYDGTSVEVVPGLPSGGNVVARTVAVWNNAVWLGNTVEGGTVFPVRIRRCDTGDPTNWSTGTAGFEDLHDRPDHVMRLLILGPYLIAYRSNCISRGTWVGAADLLVSFEVAVAGTGAIGTRAVAHIEDDHVLLANDGIYSYKGGFEVTPKDTAVRDFLYGKSGILNASKAHLSHVEHVEESQEIWVAVPTTSNTYLDTLLRLDDSGRWLRRTFGHQIIGFGEFQITSVTQWNELVGSWLVQVGPWVSRATSISSPSIALCGQTTNQVYEYDFAADTDDGTAVSWRVETKDFTARDKKIRVDRLDAFIKGDSIVAEYSLDNGQSWATYGTFESAAALTRKRLFKQITGDSVRFAFKGTGQGFVLGWIGFKFREESEW